MLRILLVLILLSHDLAIAACNRYSDADECISSGNSLDLLWSFLATALIWLFIYNSIFKKEQEDNWHKTLSDETEEQKGDASRGRQFECPYSNAEVHGLHGGTSTRANCFGTVL